MLWLARFRANLTACPTAARRQGQAKAYPTNRQAIRTLFFRVGLWRLITRPDAFGAPRQRLHRAGAAYGHSGLSQSVQEG
jgi:hypothetical protein